MKAGIKTMCNNCRKIRNSTHMFSIHSRHGMCHYCGAKKCKAIWKEFVERKTKERMNFRIEKERIMICNW